MDENEVTIEELVQIELAMIDAVIDAVGEPIPHFVQHKRQVSELLDRLQSGAVAPEYAEAELHRFRDELDRCQREKDRTFRAENPDLPY